MSFYSIAPGRVEARYTAPTAYEGYPGVVHGGILASMMDEVVGRVAMTDDPNHFLVTAKLELRYRKPVPTGVELRLTGELQRQRGRMVYATAQLFLPDGSVGVEAEATLVDKPGEKVDEDLLRSLGWKVYPETDR
ncbi:MAG: PaaI family thioesterase [Anaerolineales bacterium]